MNVISMPAMPLCTKLKVPALKHRRGLFTGYAAACLLFGVLSASAATNVVKMVGTSFQPQFLTNNPGDTVLWTNTSTLTLHNVISSNSVWTAVAAFPSPGTFQVTLTTPGLYGYYCGPHHLFGMVGTIYVRAANQAPTVSLTDPVSGITLAAPATITLKATASDPDGTVAKVEFFSGTSSLGTVTSAPYSITVPNLAAGPYSFTAQAQDNGGLSATSSVVNVSVVTPAPVHFQPSFSAAGGEFLLALETTPGLGYEITSSTDLSNWLSFTNFVATGPVASFAVPTASPSQRLFRARLLPNP